MQIELESEIFKVYWWDENQSILIIELLAPWSWDVMYDLVERTNELLDDMTHETYSILYVHERVGQFPKDNQLSIKHISRLINLDPSKEELVFFTGNIQFLKILIKISDTVHQLTRKTNKYHYADSVEDALATIQEHQLRIRL